MLMPVLFSTRAHGGCFVDYAGVYPGWRESAEICTFAALVDTVFFLSFFAKECSPTRIHLFEDINYFLESLLRWFAIKFEDAVNTELSSYGCFELEERGAGSEDVGGTRYDEFREVAAGYFGENDGCERFLCPFGGAVEYKVDSFE